MSVLDVDSTELGGRLSHTLLPFIENDIQIIAINVLHVCPMWGHLQLLIFLPQIRSYLVLIKSHEAFTGKEDVGPYTARSWPFLS